MLILVLLFVILNYVNYFAIKLFVVCMSIIYNVGYETVFIQNVVTYIVILLNLTLYRAFLPFLNYLFDILIF
jgi:hypothetical protein